MNKKFTAMGRNKPHKHGIVKSESNFLKASFLKCPYVHTHFVKFGDKGEMLIVYLYVDDLIFIGNCDIMFKDFKKFMIGDFEMSDFGMICFFLLLTGLFK